MPIENKAVARQFLEGFNSSNLAIAAEFIAASFTNHDPGTPPLPAGPEGYKQLVGMYRGIYPDLQMSVDDLIGEGDKVVCRWTARGTNTGPLMGMPATGKQATVTGISILTIINGKVTEQRANWDTLGMLQQLGVVPTPGQ
ncbi:MAG: ester cyclase [Anaerolineae bacterium]|nr:ester cyclase [Anaerolineae bacterium]